MKARIAKLRRELITPKGGGGGPGEGFDVAKTGDARIGFVGNFFIYTFNFSTFDNNSYLFRSHLELKKKLLDPDLCIACQKLLKKKSNY